MQRVARARLLHGSLALFAAAAAVLVLGVASAGAANLVTNGSFETGDFTGWTTTDPGSDPGDPCAVWRVLLSPSSDWCYAGFDSSWPTSISAMDGSYFADVTWDGNGTGDALLSQTVTVPASSTDVTLDWFDNTSWDTFFATESRVEYVDILSSDGSTLQSVPIQTLAPGTIGATGWVAHALGGLDAFAGQTVQIQFRLTVPEFFTGPANFALDGVTLESSPTGYAGTPGQASCVGQSVSTLSNEFNGDLSAAAQALGFDSVKALQKDIKQFCSS